MALLQPRLNLKVSQKQILTPGLVQMVSVLALNKLELADMINAELTENPVLEELDDSVPLLDEVSAREEKMERDSSLAAAGAAGRLHREEKDPFEEIDFGSFFSEYLDPGLRTPIEMEDSEKPSFENFLSKPSTLTDHLMWQLGSLHVKEDVYRAAELVIGNLNEEGYLTATDDELLGLAQEEPDGRRFPSRSQPIAASAARRRSWRRRTMVLQPEHAQRAGVAVACGRAGQSKPELRCPAPRDCSLAASDAGSSTHLRPRAFRSAATPCAKPSTW